MSGERVETVRAIYEQWSAGNFETGVDVYDEQILLVLRQEFPESGTYVGADAIAEYTRGLLESLSDFTIEAEELIGAGDSVVVAVQQSGIGRSSGIHTDLRYFMLWTFRGEKVIRIESVRTRGEALAALGLRDDN